MQQLNITSNYFYQNSNSCSILLLWISILEYMKIRSKDDTNCNVRSDGLQLVFYRTYTHHQHGAILWYRFLHENTSTRQQDHLWNCCGILLAGAGCRLAQVSVLNNIFPLLSARQKGHHVAVERQSKATRGCGVAVNE